MSFLDLMALACTNRAHGRTVAPLLLQRFWLIDADESCACSMISVRAPRTILLEFGRKLCGSEWIQLRVDGKHRYWIRTSCPPNMTFGLSRRVGAFGNLLRLESRRLFQAKWQFPTLELTESASFHHSNGTAKAKAKPSWTTTSLRTIWETLMLGSWLQLWPGMIPYNASM